MSGKKYDAGKPEYDRLSFQALGEFNKVHKAGDEKYSKGNWKEGLHVTRLINAAIRHLTTLLEGKTMDDETKTLHSANAGVNCEMITHFLLNRDKYEDFIDLPVKKSVEYRSACAMELDNKPINVEINLVLGKTYEASDGWLWTVETESAVEGYYLCHNGIMGYGTFDYKGEYIGSVSDGRNFGNIIKEEGDPQC